MNWEAVGAIGEVLGAAGVIVTLAYLALQIRQNSEHIEHNVRSQRLAASASMHHDVMQIRLAFVSDPELLRIMGQGRANPDALESSERSRFFVMCTLLFEQLEFAYERRREGLADWSSFEHYLKDYTSSPGVQVWWAKHGSGIFSEAFADEVRRQLKVWGAPTESGTAL